MVLSVASFSYLLCPDILGFNSSVMFCILSVSSVTREGTSSDSDNAAHERLVYHYLLTWSVQVSFALTVRSCSVFCQCPVWQEKVPAVRAIMQHMIELTKSWLWKLEKTPDRERKLRLILQSTTAITVWSKQTESLSTGQTKVDKNTTLKRFHRFLCPVKELECGTFH